MNRPVEFTTESLNALIGALELSDLAIRSGDSALEISANGLDVGPTTYASGCAITRTLTGCGRIDDAALEGAVQVGPNGPTSILANCYATKSALCPRIDDERIDFA